MRRRATVMCALAGLALLIYAQEKFMVEMNNVRLYLPDSILRQRLGQDASPLAAYIKALHQETVAFWDQADKPPARGLLIGVGVKPDQKVRVWCDAVGGDIPPDTLAKLARKLAAVPAVAVRQGPIAFAVEIILREPKPEPFPQMPAAWLEAAKQSRAPLTVPDGLFPILWPDEGER